MPALGIRSRALLRASLGAALLGGCAARASEDPRPVEAPDMACEVRHDLDAWRAAAERERDAAGLTEPLIAVDVAARDESTCAVDGEGAVWCWGLLGSTRAAPQEIALGGPARAIDAGATGYCAVLVDGSLACFDFGAETLNRTRFSRPATTVAMAASTGLVRLDDGRYACILDSGKSCPGGAWWAIETFADGDLACLGEATATHAEGRCHGGAVRLGSSPTRCGGRGRGRDGCDDAVVERVSTDLDQCERLADGSVRCAGEFARRRVAAGLAPAPSVFEPFVRVPLPEAAVELVSGAEHVCARLACGGLRCWGRNSSGQAGAGPTAGGFTPAPVVGLPEVVALYGGGSGFCARDREDALWCWGATPEPRRDPASPCVNRRATPTRLGDFAGYREIDVDRGEVCGLDVRGRLRCVGWFRRPHRSLRAGLRDRRQLRDIGLDGELCVLRGSGEISCRGPRGRCRDCEDGAFFGGAVEIDGSCARTTAEAVVCWRSHVAEGALDGAPERDAWLGGWFEPALSALHEPALTAESGAHVVRVLVLPSFDHARSMRVKIRRSGRGVLIVRRASGWGGYDPGYLSRARRVPLSRVQVRRLLFLLERADFWVSGATFGYPGRNDGTMVVLEAVRGGRYHVVHDDYAGVLGQIVRLLHRYARPLRSGGR